MKNKINLLILVDKFDYHGSSINGPTRNYSWLIKRIDKKNFNVFLYALRKGGQSKEIFKREGVHIKYLNLQKFNPLTLLFVIKIIKINDIDILHLQGYGSVLFGQLAGRILRKTTIIKEEWVDHNIGPLQRILERLLNLSADKVIAISNYAKKFLIEKKGVKESKIATIPNGIPLDSFRNADAAVGSDIRRSMGISDSDIIIGIVGMLHENKGHEYFIDAASIIARKKKNTKFVIIGDGERRRELEEYVKHRRLKDKVIFMGKGLTCLKYIKC